MQKMDRVLITGVSIVYSAEANLMLLHLLVHHHKGYNQTKNHNFARLFDKICLFIDMQKMDRVLIKGVSIVCDKL